MKPFLPLALAAAAIAAPSAHASVYKITSATHTSSSAKKDERYSGTSTATWKLARPTKEATNRIEVLYGPGFGIYGMARVNVTGSYGVDITTTWPGRCAWSVSTGDQSDRRAMAPDVFDLVVGRDPKNPKRTIVAHTGVAASLGNGWLGTECSTDLGGEPEQDDTQLKSIPLNTFKKKKTVTLVFAGSTSKEGIAYSWKTKFVLRRVKR
jgi:hypothetical protein